MFPDEDSARKWFEQPRWPNGRACAKCGSIKTSKVPNATPMPYWCSDCRSYFSVKLGTLMQGSNLPMRKWAIAIYLVTTNLKGVSSMKLHRDLDIAQKNAWHMLHRIRKAMQGGDPLFNGPVKPMKPLSGVRKLTSTIARSSTLAGRLARPPLRE